MKKRKAYRHGDVILLCDGKIPEDAKALGHLVLAEGEATGHKHEVTEGVATLFESFREEDTPAGKIRFRDHFLSVKSEMATLTHQEHAAISLPRGIYHVVHQREYEPKSWRSVRD